MCLGTCLEMRSKDMYQPFERGLNAGTPSYTGAQSKGYATLATWQNGNVISLSLHSAESTGNA
jgi:hypothetical protein